MISVNQNRLIQSFLDMTAIDAPSRGERALADFVREQFMQQGCHVTEDDAGSDIGGNCGNLYIHCEGSLNQPPLLLSAHLDTVEPAKNKQPYVDAQGVIRSRGNTVLGADDVAGIAAILEAVQVLRENGEPHRPIEILLSVAEEAHLQGISAFNPAMITARQGYVLDTSGSPGTGILQAPGHIKLCFSISGQAAHAGIEPEKGISAIVIAANAISRMKLGRPDPETTANIGQITGGGETNIVAEQCQFTAECRSLSMEKLKTYVQDMKNCALEAAATAGGKVTIEESVSYLPYQIPANSELATRFAQVCQNMNLSPNFIKTGGGSDSNVLHQHGIQAMVISCGMRDVHSVEEHIYVRELVQITDMVIRLIQFSSAEKHQ